MGADQTDVRELLLGVAKGLQGNWRGRRVAQRRDDVV